MAKTTEKVRDSASNVKPYVERALKDEDLRASVKNAYESARSIYDELVGHRGLVTTASRVATDKEIQDQLRKTVEELRTAADRLQGKKHEHSARNSSLLLVGIALGILFNPATGPATRKWLADRLLGSSDDFTYESSNGGTGSTAGSSS
jgi:predicted RNA-binding protein